MSAPGPPELPLEAARAHLTRQGYLRAALPPHPPSRWRAALATALLSLVLAATLGWATVAAGGGDAATVPVLFAAYVPLVAAVVVAGRYAGVWSGRLLLRLGARPAGIAEALAVVGALGLLALLAVAVWGGAEHPAVAVLAPEAVGIVLAFAVLHAGRLSLDRRLAFAPVRAAGPRRWAPFGVVALAGVVLALPSVATRGAPGDRVAAATFPRPTGRVAALAVDGLAREDVDALAAGDASWSRIAAWRWAPLDVGDDAMPAVLWTTVACGVPSAEHGVHVLDEVRLFGRRGGVALRGCLRFAVLTVWRPVGLAQVVARPASERRVPTFWEMASRAGCPVTVGGWWGSWPVRRLLGEVVSERAWLGGGSGKDAVSPSLAEVVRSVWARTPAAAAATDALAAELARRAAAAPAPHVVALSLPALDLLHRRRQQPAVALAAASRDHLTNLVAVAETLVRAGYETWLVAVPWGPGTPFVACSGAVGSTRAAVPTEALAATWLVDLGLPPPLGAAAARIDLAGRTGSTPAGVGYGPPPAPLAAPPLKALEVQREVLRSLGYLQ